MIFLACRLCKLRFCPTKLSKKANFDLHRQDAILLKNRNTAPKGGGVAIYGAKYQTFIFPDHSKSLMNRPPMTVRFWKWMWSAPMVSYQSVMGTRWRVKW